MQKTTSENKILILLSSFEGGGAERIAATVADYLSQHNSVLFAVIKNNSYTKYSTSVPVRYLSKPHKYRNFAYLIFPLVVLRYIMLIHTYHPDITLSILPLDNAVNLLISHLFKIPAVMSAHGMRSKSGKGLVKCCVSLEEWLLKHTDAKAIVVSNGVKDSMVDNFGQNPDKIHVIYNPIDVAKIHQSIEEENPSNLLASDIPTIITAGRLYPIKAQWHLIRSFAALRRERPARLLICGVGDEEAYLKSLAQDLGVADDVIFLGWQENPYKYMARSTVFVLSSISEALPNVLTEAMASGCLVISANCSPGVREIIGEHNEYGLLAESMTGIRHAADEPLDSGEMSLLTLMRKVIDDKELREEYVRRGKERAEFFSMEKRVKEYEGVIWECMS